MHRLAVNDGSARNRAATEYLANFANWSPGKRSVFRRSPQIVSVDVIDDRILRFCNFCCIFGDGVQHWLNIRRRAGDDAQDFTRRRLLLQRFFEFLEQPHVLDCDHRLVREGFEELDLRRGEGAHLGCDARPVPR